jgi:hypothetical protein
MADVAEGKRYRYADGNAKISRGAGDNQVIARAPPCLRDDSLSKSIRFRDRGQRLPGRGTVERTDARGARGGIVNDVIPHGGATFAFGAGVV